MMSRVVNFKPAEDGQNLPGSTGQNKSGVVIIALAITLIYLSIQKNVPEIIHQHIESVIGIIHFTDT